MKKMMERFKNERGLTLVELLAVVVILAIIGTIAFVLIGNVIDNSRKDAHIANAQQLIASAKLYEASGESLDGGVEAEQLMDKEFLEPLVSPWGDEPADYGDDAEVTKDTDGKYHVEIAGKDCDIDNTEEEILTKDRDEICGSE